MGTLVREAGPSGQPRAAGQADDEADIADVFSAESRRAGFESEADPDGRAWLTCFLYDDRSLLAGDYLARGLDIEVNFPDDRPPAYADLLRTIERSLARVCECELERIDITIFARTFASHTRESWKGRLFASRRRTNRMFGDYDGRARADRESAAAQAFYAEAHTAPKRGASDEGADAAGAHSDDAGPCGERSSGGTGSAGGAIGSGGTGGGDARLSAGAGAGGATLGEKATCDDGAVRRGDPVGLGLRSDRNPSTSVTVTIAHSDGSSLQEGAQRQTIHSETLPNARGAAEWTGFPSSNREGPPNAWTTEYLAQICEEASPRLHTILAGGKNAHLTLVRHKP